MTSHTSADRPLAAEPSGPLRGRVRPPGDSAVAHRALICGLLAVGATRIDGMPDSDEVRRTARACAALGATLTHDGATSIVHGMGVGALLAPRAPLDFGDCGAAARLMLGVIAGHPIRAILDGDASLRRRPMRRVLEPLALMGARVLQQGDGGRCPIEIQGTAEPTPLDYRTPIMSSQVKSAMLLAGLNAPGTTILVEPRPSRDHTERMLALFGADIVVETQEDGGRRIVSRGRPSLRPRALAIPADPSAAAFAIVAATIVPGSDIVVENVMMNPLRTGFIETLRAMGAAIEIHDRREAGGEETADVAVRAAPLRGIDVPASRVPSMIADYPILAMAAAVASGDTRLRGLHDLRVRETDRVRAIADGLGRCGIDHAVEGDDLVVRGRAGCVPGGCQVATDGDHRIAMSFLCLGLAARRPIGIDISATIAARYPGFESDLARLGATFR